MMEETVIFRSGGVSLEGKLSYEEDSKIPLAKLLLCPPHPFLGGDMDNNVVCQLTRILSGHNFLVLRFNYRGIGRSTTDRDLQQNLKEFWEHSTCPDYEARLHVDCRSALRLLQDTLDRDWPIAIIGYSFGCLPAIELSMGNDITKLVLVSPPLTKWKIDSNRMRQEMPKAIFYAPGDFACPEADVSALYQQLAGPKLIRSFPDAEHFFIGQEAGLADAIHQFLVQ